MEAPSTGFEARSAIASRLAEGQGRFALLPWTPTEAGTYRVNKVKEGGEGNIGIECSPSDGDELPKAFVDYEEHPREYTLRYIVRPWSPGLRYECGTSASKKIASPVVSWCRTLSTESSKRPWVTTKFSVVAAGCG